MSYQAPPVWCLHGTVSRLQYMARFSELLDLNRMYCNDLHSMAEIYGIEAASKAIVKVSRTAGGSVERWHGNVMEGAERSVEKPGPTPSAK